MLIGDGEVHTLLFPILSLIVIEGVALTIVPLLYVVLYDAAVQPLPPSEHVREITLLAFVQVVLPPDHVPQVGAVVSILSIV